MSANPSIPHAETGDSMLPYPGYGTPEDTQACIKLLDWICEQYGNGNVKAKVGDFILATDGRILGVGDNSDELYQRVIAAEPSLGNARLVEYFVPLSEY